MLAVSAAAWVVLVFDPGEAALATEHCSAEFLGTSPTLSLDTMTAMKSAYGLEVAWLVMLTAMMAPMLVAPVRHVWDGSFARRRIRATALFVAGYAMIWTAAGTILIALAAAARIAAPAPFAPLTLATCVALVWQSSPAKQRCLNRGHAHPALAAFGSEADVDVVRFGLTHGAWCVGSCWALMLLPLLVIHGHVVAMAPVTLWLLGERLDTPMQPRWDLRVPRRAAQLVLAQLRSTSSANIPSGLG